MELPVIDGGRRNSVAFAAHLASRPLTSSLWCFGAPGRWIAIEFMSRWYEGAQVRARSGLATGE